MLFQTLDDKQSCVAVYADNDLKFNINIDSSLDKTWNYSNYLKGKNVDYASLYCEGKSIEQVCPENLKDELDINTKRLKSFMNSFIQAKVSLRENCFFDLVPRKFLIDYCQIKNKVTEHVFSTYEKPKEYEFYRKFTELLNDIKYRELNISLENMENKLGNADSLAYYRKINESNKYINYNMFGSITGRLTVKKDSFPILTFPKQYRSILLPKNDWFVSFDMNAAELRTALALAGHKQPDNDFHEWSVGNIYNNELKRVEAKETTTAWLYNSNSALAQKYDANLSNIFDKATLKKKYWINGAVHTPYNRIIPADEHHAISYLNQSTFIDLFHRQIIKVNDYLNGRRSFVSFMIHDEFVLDVSDDEKGEIENVIKILQDTPYGKFIVNIKAGKDYGNMKKLNLKV